MYKTHKQRLTKFFDPVKSKAVDITSDILTVIPRMKAKAAGRQADKDVKALKLARAYDNAPDFDEKGMPTDALKARTMAEEVRFRVGRKNKKK